MCYVSPQSVEIRPVDSRKSSLEEYVHLPSRLYRHEPRWVPPFYADEWAFHHPHKNKALTYCETIRLMAWHESVPLGRIMGIIHHPYNKAHACKTARFFHFDCINNPEIAHALLTAIEKWARDKGMSKVIGPFGFSDKDPQGLQIEGFEYLPVLAAPANPPYLPALVEHEGYLKEVDCVSYRMDVPRQVPPLYQKITDRLSASNRFKLTEFTSKRQLKPYILPVLRLMNKAYAHLFGFTPLDEEEMKKFADQYLPVLDPEFVKAVVTKNQELIAFAIAMPDMSPGIQKAKGKLFPLGFIHILRAMRKTKQLNLMLGAIKPGFQGLGFSAWMGQALLNSAHKRGLTVMDSHLILENNYPMRSECEKINGTVYKRFRIFSKLL